MNIAKSFAALLLLIAVIVAYNCNARNTGALPKPKAKGPNSASLTWDVPQKKTNGSALNNIKGYMIYYGTASLSYAEVVQVPIGDPALSCQIIESTDKQNPSKKQCVYQIKGLGKGSYYFAVTAYDDKGNESDFSNEVSRRFK